MDPLTSRPGFSSLQLALVVAIVGVLVLGLLAPRYVAGLGKSREAACMNNLRQLQMALTLYAQDYKGWLPASPEPWTAVNEYAGNQAIFLCPAAPHVPVGNVAAPGMLSVTPDYLYLPGLATADPPESPVLADNEPRHHGRANVVLLGGQAFAVSVEEWRQMGFGGVAQGGATP